MSGDVALSLLDWERNDNPKAPLSARQMEAIQEMEMCFIHRPLPSKFEKIANPGQICEANQSEKNADNSSDVTKSSLVPAHFCNLFENKLKIETAHQFYHWFANVEDDMLNEDDIKYRLVLDHLKEYSQQCGDLLHEVEVCMNYLKMLTQQYQFVSNKTNNLHEACEHLLAEQTKLMNTVLEIDEKLVYFNESDKISTKLNSPTLSVTNESFMPMLARIDECIGFLITNSNYKESGPYLVKFRHCLTKALSLIHTYIVKSLQHATQQVLPTSESPKALDNTFTLFYGKFRTNAARIKILTEQIELRVNSSQEYEQLLSDCHQCYFTQRDLLITSSVATTVAELASNYQRDHCTLVRSGCNLLLHICEDEYQLFFQFFSKPGQQLDTFLEKLCTKLYDTLRPMIIHINHLETLAELCSILKVEMLEEHIHNSANRLTVFEACITQMLQDVQERLVYRSHIYIQSDILNYKPAPGDLAYPEKLEMMESIAESLMQAKLSRTDSQTSITSTCSITSQEVASITAASEQQSNTHSSLVGYSPADFHGMWYPTVRRTLNCLSKLYRCIPKSIFQGLSQDALAMCILSLINAGDMIGKNQTPLDGHLFQIKHLLILREQITPFQVDFSVKETTLDFSKIRSAAVNLLHKRSRLFSFSSTNAVLEFIIQGTPQVTEHFLDSKKDVDNHLKSVCDALIAHCTTLLTGPLNGFLEKANVILKVNDDSGRQILLRNQPFASTEQVTGIVTEANRQLKSKLPLLHRSMALYLANRETEAILFRPIKKNIVNTYQQLQEVVHIHYSEEDQVIIGCPSTEQAILLLSTLLHKANNILPPLKQLSVSLRLVMLGKHQSSSSFSPSEHTTSKHGLDPLEPDVSEVVYNIVVYPLGSLIVLANVSGLIYMIVTKYLRHPAYHYVASLAVADTGLGLYLVLANALSGNHEDFIVCLIKLCSITILCTGSIFSILSIAIDRYLFLVHAVHYYQWVTFRYSIYLIAVIWVLAALIGFLPVLGYKSHNELFGTDCLFVYMAAPTYIIVVVVIYFTVPMLSISVLYGRILQMAIRQRRELLRQTTPADPFDNSRNSITRISGIALLRGLRAVKVVVVIVGVFLVTWMPFFVATLVQIACGTSCQKATSIVSYLSLLGFLNSLLNPCIYAYFGLEMRNKACSAAYRFLCSCCRHPTRIEPEVSWQGL